MCLQSRRDAMFIETLSPMQLSPVGAKCLSPKNCPNFSIEVAYGEKGELDRAIDDWNKAIELDPKLAQAYNNRGAAYNGTGEHDLAIKDYTTAIKHQPDHGKAYSNRGIVRLYLQEWENFR